MPRIRKKTSNRQGTNDRRKIQRKVRESRKKRSKEAKKNPQWKSKHKKDPGIPNDFPYKDQILAEVAEQRRIAIEAKAKRREEKRLARQHANSDSQDPHEGGQDQDEALTSKNLDVGSDAIASLSVKLINPQLTTREEKKSLVAHSDGEEEAPVLINRDLPNLKAVLDGSDVLLEVLDARDPLPFRSAFLEKMMGEKKVLLVLNKIDLCPREALTSWLTYLRREYPTFLFKSATAFLPTESGPCTPVQGGGRKALSSKSDALGSEAILSQLASWAAEKEDAALRIAVSGLTNAGKSSFLNSLIQKAALPVYSLSTSSRGASTTTLPQEVTVKVDDKVMHFIDTPSLTWSADLLENEHNSLEKLRSRDILLRSRGRIDRLKDPSSAVSHIVERATPEDLMVMYSLPAFAQGDVAAFLSGVARSNQLVKKRGELDLAGASKIVLRDWNTGKLARYTSPPKDDGAKEVTPLAEADEKVLSHSRTRKEMRKKNGLVKLLASEIEKRAVYLESPWEAEKEHDRGNDGMIDQRMELNEEGRDDDEVNQDDDDDDSEEDDGQEESESEESESSPQDPFSRKRKRTTSSVPAQSVKKVAFASRKQRKPAGPSTKDPQEEKNTKSILKKVAASTKQKPSKLGLPNPRKGAPGKPANVPSALKKRGGVTDDPHAYDFTKFF